MTNLELAIFMIPSIESCSVESCMRSYRVEPFNVELSVDDGIALSIELLALRSTPSVE